MHKVHSYYLATGLMTLSHLCFPLLALAEHADVVLVGANIISMDGQNSRYSAIAIQDQKIVGLGNELALQSWMGEHTRIIDLAGKTVLPGFVDQHNHIFEGASEVGGNCELSQSRPLPQQDAWIEGCVDADMQHGEWVIGYGFQLDLFMDYEDDITPREWLDSYFPENPVVIMEESSHAMIVNTLALQASGFLQTDTQPVGGRVMYEEDGFANGILFDNAGDQVMELAWNAQSGVFEQSYAGLLAGIDEVIRHGITTVGDGRMYWRRGWYEVWQQAHSNGEIALRVALRPWIYPDLDKSVQLGFLASIRSSDLTHDLIVNQAKLYVDGVLHFGTAKVAEPYAWSWQSDIPQGLNYIAPDALTEWLTDLGSLGLGAHIHAIGDLGISEALDAIAVQRKNGSAQLYGLTHLEMLNSRDVSRFKALDVSGDFQAGASFFAEHDWAVPYIGVLRAKGLMPMRKLFDSGANLTISSDWTVNSINPLVTIANAVRLKHSNGLPSVEQAIAAHTINAARALGIESVTGSLETGKFADLVVLDRDITELSADEIETTGILMTIYKGEVVYANENQP